MTNALRPMGHQSMDERAGAHVIATDEGVLARHLRHRARCALREFTRNENVLTDKMWGIEELAGYLGIPKQTIYQWRTKGYGPPGCRIGKYVKYLPSDVERWINEQRTN